MQPQDIQVIGDELAIKWPDGGEDYIRLERLRRCCPCASCRGEVDILGHLHRGPEKPLTESSVRLTRLGRVGGYALQPVWADGHSSGIYSYDFLREIARSSGGGG